METTKESIGDLVKRHIVWYETYYITDLFGEFYTDEELDFKARENLTKVMPMFSWTNLEHTNMLFEMAIDSHDPARRYEYKKGRWSKKTVCIESLKKLHRCYNMWTNIK